MFQRPVPTEIDFTEKQDDEAITDMNELIERTKRERELEYTQYVASSPNNSPTKLSLNIQEDISENLMTENIEITDKIEEFPISKGSVSFKESDSEIKEHSFQKLENLILQMNENIENIQQKMCKIDVIIDFFTKMNSQEIPKSRSNDSEVLEIKEVSEVSEVSEKYLENDSESK